MGQADKDTVELFDKGRYVRVPQEIAIEQDAKISHRGVLTHYIFAESNDGRSQTTAILTRTNDNELRFFFSVFIFRPWERS